MAASAYLDAARAEAAALRIDAALSLARRGAELAAAPVTRFALALLEGELEWSIGHAAQSIVAHERALAAAADDRERALAWVGVAAAHRLTSSVAPGLAALDRAAQFANLDARVAARIHYLRGSFQFAQGDVAACRAEHERALAFAQQAGDPEYEAQALSGLADALYAQGRMQSARVLFGRCVDRFTAAGLMRSTIMNRCMIAIIDAYNGHVDAALAEIEAAGALAHDVRHRLAETMASEAHGLMLVMAGRYEDARDVLENGLALSREVRARRFESIICYCLSRACWRGGDAETARRYAQEALTLAMDVGPRFAGPIALGAVAMCAETDDARRRALAEAERLLEQGCVAHCYIGFYRDAIEIALAHDEWDEAERYAGALEKFLEGEPLRLITWLVASARALAAAGRGRPDRAALDACRREAAAMGMRVAAADLATRIEALR